MTVTSSIPPSDTQHPSSGQISLPPDDGTKSPDGDRFSHVAARILRQKLDSVVAAIPLAIEHWKKDPKHIHRLRVATRRASAAMKAFAPLLPHKRARRLRRELSRLRRAVGEARDLDVLQLRLRKGSYKVSAKVLKEGRKFVARRRKKAQRQCELAQDRLQSMDFTRRIDGLLQRVRWRDSAAEPSFRNAAGQLIDRALIDFRAAIRMDVSSPDAIHQLRIEAKQIRYTLELFDDLSRLPELRREVKALQERLGNLNDGAAARARFLSWASQTKSPKNKPLLRKLAKDRKRLVTKMTREFYQWWPDEQQRLLALLDEIQNCVA